MDKQEVQNIVQQGESYYTEFKETLNKDIVQEFVAFANASGGKILLGISDDGTITGFSFDNRVKSQIQDMAANCDPPVTVIPDAFDDGIVIYVWEGDHKPHRCTKGFFLRQGANSQKLTTDEIVDFIQKEGRVRFDARIRKDIDFQEYFDGEIYQQYLKEAGLTNVQQEPEVLLSNIGAVKPDDKRYSFTNAGLLFFTRQVTSFLPQAAVQCASYKGREKVDILDRKFLDNDLITNIHEAMLFLERHLNKGAIIEGMKREDALEIPEVALREAIVNAVTHRDYFEEGAYVTIEVFQDRVEIANPGGLPGGFSSDELGNRSLARNPVIAEILLRTSYIERLGTGINRIRTEMVEAGLPAPVFTYNNFFSITFRRAIGDIKEAEKTSQSGFKKDDAVSDTVNDTVGDTVNDTVNDTVKLRLANMIRLLYQEPGLRSNAIAERLGVTEVTVRRDMQKLQSLVEFQGPPKTGGYYLTEKMWAKLGKHS